MNEAAQMDILWSLLTLGDREATEEEKHKAQYIISGWRATMKEWMEERDRQLLADYADQLPQHFARSDQLWLAWKWRNGIPGDD